MSNYRDVDIVFRGLARVVYLPFSMTAQRETLEIMKIQLETALARSGEDRVTAFFTPIPEPAFNEPITWEEGHGQQREWSPQKEGPKEETRIARKLGPVSGRPGEGMGGGA